MSTFDIGIGMTQATLNDAVATFFRRPRLRSTLFQGRRSLELMGIPVVAGWEILEAPILRLAPPAEELWQNAIDQSGQTPTAVPGAFTLELPRLHVSLGQPDGGARETELVATVIATASLSQNDLALDARALVVDLAQASELDRLIYQTFIIPQVLQATDALFSGREIPDISFQGLSFGSVTIVIDEGRIIALANLAGKPAPPPVNSNTLPDRPFFILLSREAMAIAAQRGGSGMQGKVIERTGVERYSIASAEYKAQIRLDSVVAQPSAALTELDVVVAISPSLVAGVSVFQALGNEVVNTANQAGNEVVNTANQVGDTFKQAGREIEKAFSSY